MNNEMCKEFEKWVSSHPYLSKCRKNRNKFVQNDYFDPVMSIAWRVWQSLMEGKEVIIPETHWGEVFRDTVNLKDMEKAMKTK